VTSLAPCWREGGEVYDVQDWAEVRRLDVAGVSKAEIARRLGMSRTTVYELLARDEPPAYVRKQMLSMVAPVPWSRPESSTRSDPRNHRLVVP
jgi:DNA invertase Pin-like site-specific DNA recombinase